MPDFGNPFSGLAADRKLTRNELVRAIRFMVAAEYEAVQLYTQLAESIEDELSRSVLLDIADEEIVHAGEFLALLKRLAPGEDGLYAEGALEVQEIAEKLQEKEDVAETGEAARETSSPTVGDLVEKD